MCLELEVLAFAGVFLGTAVLPWRWFYVFQLADEPAYLDVLSLPVRVVIRIVALVVGLGVLGLAASQCL